MGGSVGYSVNTNATSGANGKTGDIGQYFGGIQTGGTSGGLPTWALIAAVALAALYILKR
jgi:hypothetical protein